MQMHDAARRELVTNAAMREWSNTLTLGERVAFLLRYEPCWYVEFSNAIGSITWGICTIATDDYRISSMGYTLSTLAIILGLARWSLLLRLWWGPRAFVAALSASLWAWIFLGAFDRYGAIGILGPTLSGMVGDTLMLMRFSLPCAQDIIADFRDWRNG